MREWLHQVNSKVIPSGLTLNVTPPEGHLRPLDQVSSPAWLLVIFPHTLPCNLTVHLPPPNGNLIDRLLHGSVPSAQHLA